MTYDNTCKYLAEKYPEQFFRWLLSTETTDIRVLKTELTIEPIRADSVSFLQTNSSILHLEFETRAYSDPPMPLRMLDYYTRLKRQYSCAIEQVVIFLQETGSDLVFVSEYTDTNTRHRYRVIRLWEEDPAPFLANPALLPLATLTRTDSPQGLLQQVAAQAARIESIDEQRNILACADVIAGLRFDEEIIHRIFRKNVMKESVTYQAILEEGREEEALSLILRQMGRRIGTLDPQLQDRIRALSRSQLEALSEALLDFSTAADLIDWLDRESQ
ncbi:Rpn family recombination-promoting nuclease/putative transposase [Argonema galeatum]|uniref:Rpn family recombination-promoting nuclease/putative transposase n=1 Tax=Argonema galeatum TaxID=2942762 RepID=UPI002013752C|nr:Rpn family recombination-promoting nuclease/putative transposase [Argonema galeatum]MCL1463914.1 Rpn family recombination-promoting nuclease/putative transposase [Argonema galeatum A003/A1]